MTRAKTIITFLIQTFLNIALTFLLISVLADGLLDYKTGFYVLAPFILGLTFWILYFFYIQTINFKRKTISSLNYSWTIAFIFINVIIILFNYLSWIDLFDGTTETMFP
ncbi:MAG TPA: hypothetical protein VE978_21480 [Chitinophagales bacterium]|nr:hypothetical protein [Chitinophagales bacterium]